MQVVVVRTSGERDALKLTETAMRCPATAT